MLMSNFTLPTCHFHSFIQQLAVTATMLVLVIRSSCMRLAQLAPVASAVLPHGGRSLTLRFALFPPGGRPGLRLLTVLRACLLAVLAVGLAFMLSSTPLHANLPMPRADGNAVKAQFSVAGLQLRWRYVFGWWLVVVVVVMVLVVLTCEVAVFGSVLAV